MLTTWDAVSTLDRMLDDVMGSAYRTAPNSRTFSPAIDVRANENEVVFICDVPGVKEEDLEVTLENHVLTIKGVRKLEAKKNDTDHIALGRAYGEFHRAYTLPDSLDEEKLSASLADGVLTISIPKQPRAKPRKIPIGHSSTTKQLKE